MALGGGTFLVQNKVLPGAYINFISAAKAAASLSDRGVVTMPLELDWGVDDAVFEVTIDDFQKKSVELFGYGYSHDKLKGLRDLFLHSKRLYAYKLTSGGEKASNLFAVAKYSGIRGNDMTVIIQTNVNDAEKFDVNLRLGGSLVASQTVATAAELADNAFVTWVKDASLAASAGTPLTGGTNGAVTGASHQSYLDKIESYAFNTLGVVTSDAVTKALYAAFTKRMRDTVGAKFQTVLYGCAADYEGVINLKNVTTDTGFAEASLVYWVTAVTAGCPVNTSNLNKQYDGEFTVSVEYTQAQLSLAILGGEFALHKVGDSVRVLSDVTSLVTTTAEKGELFKENQTIRVIDQIANDIATLFNTKYLGVIPNDASGRISLWADIVKHHQQLQSMRAIENFSDKDITVTQGATKKAVVVSDVITVVGAMAQLYMTVEVA